MNPLSFMSLLNDGGLNELEDISFSQPPPSSQQEEAKQKRGRSKNFLIEEDMLLISAWLNVSMDPVQGNNQTQTTYWSRISNYFHKNKSFPSDRTSTSLCNRWSAINTSVAKFIGFYNQICGRNQSGVNDQDKIGQAIDMYESIMKTPFMFLRHWNELRHSPKYEASLSKKTKPSTKENQSSSPSTESTFPTSLDSEFEDQMERPPGRKTAKRLKKATNETTDDEFNSLLKSMHKDALEIATSRSESLNNMMEMKKEEQELEKERMQMEKERMQMEKERQEREKILVQVTLAKEERERQAYEASILAMDTSKMDPNMARYYNALKAKIMSNIP